MLERPREHPPTNSRTNGHHQKAANSESSRVRYASPNQRKHRHCLRSACEIGGPHATLSWLCFPLPRTVQSAARTIASPFATCASFRSWPQPIIGGGAHSSTLHGRRFECKRCGYAGYVAPPPPHHVSTGVHVQLRAVYGIGGPGWLHEVGLHLRTIHGERCLVCFVEYAAVLVDNSLPLS